MKVTDLFFDADEFIALVVESTHVEPSMVRHDAKAAMPMASATPTECCKQNKSVYGGSSCCRTRAGDLANNN